MGTMASQITSLTIAFSTVYSWADQRKHRSSASLAFVRGIHRWQVNFPHKWPVTRKMFQFDDVVMLNMILRWKRHENISPCIGSRVNSKYEGIALRVGAQFRTQASESQRHLPPPTVMSNVLTIRAWPAAKNRLTSAECCHTLYATASPFEQERFPLHCLHLVLAYRYCFVWRKPENVPHLIVDVICGRLYFVLHIKHLNCWNMCRTLRDFRFYLSYAFLNFIFSIT